MKTFTDFILKYVRDSQELIRLLWTDYENILFQKTSRKLFEDIMAGMLQQAGVHTQREMHYIFNFYHAGFLSVMHSWLSDGCREEPQQMTDLLLSCFPIVEN